MAELAGRVGDGFNTAAGHPQLQARRAAREAHAKCGALDAVRDQRLGVPGEAGCKPSPVSPSTG
jgi:hypothetical protein